MSHCLLSALGVQSRPTRYTLGGRIAVAELCPLALVKLLEPAQRPDRAVVLVTPGAREQTWPAFREAFSSLVGREPERVDIPNGGDPAEVGEIVEKAARAVQGTLRSCLGGIDSARVTIDVTHGLRHFPFILYGVALYLKSLSGIEIARVCYGMDEGREQGTPRPIVDLTPLVDLPLWFQGVGEFRRLGRTALLADLAERVASEIQGEDVPREQLERKSALEGLAGSLRALSRDYESALPVELGIRARILLARLSKQPLSLLIPALPLAGELQSRLRDELDSYALRDKARQKTDVVFDDRESERQKCLIDRYLERHQTPLALGLMREWLVSVVLTRCVWKRHPSGRAWLRRADRSPAEGRLNLLAELHGQRRSTGESQDRLGAFWGRLRHARNQLHHHGMTSDTVRADSKLAEAVKEDWKEWVRDERSFEARTGSSDGRLLVTPMGRSPGVLYSALLHARPTRCLVIVSSGTQDMIASACERAGFSGPCEKFLLEDPYAGFEEFRGLCERASDTLLSVRYVDVNLTGGTTAMGILADRIARLARRHDREVRSFVLTDRRPRDQQESDPWLAAEARDVRESECLP